MNFKHNIILTLLAVSLSSLFSSANAQLYDAYSDCMPKREVRAVWLTTIFGLDWPKTKANSYAQVEQQKRELTGILDKLKAVNINTILLQTRIRGTVIYPSEYEPWDECITGEYGKAPSYDPLAFAVEECHKRGMEIHAWVVCIPLGKTDIQNKCGSKSVTRKRPDLCKKVGQDYFMIPAKEATADYISDLCKEIATKYDVDGIHLDYIRYPESLYNYSDKDLYSRASGMDYSQWKRNNITRIVQKVHDKVKAVKQWVKLSSSPVGKYDDLKRYSSKGWNCFSAVGQDPKAWLRDGIQDLIFPMMYFQGDNFFPFLCDWTQGSSGRPIVSGLAIYFLDPKEGRWTLNMVRQEMHATRDVPNSFSPYQRGCGGMCFFRSEFLTRNLKGIYNNVGDEFFKYPALPPVTAQHNASMPDSPTDIRIDNGLLTWQGNGKDERYVVYGWYEKSDEYSDLEYENYLHPSKKSHDFKPLELTSNIMASCIRENCIVIPADNRFRNNFAVTAIDRYGNESEPAILSLNSKSANRKVNTNRNITPDENGVIRIDSYKKTTGLYITDATGKLVKNSRDKVTLQTNGLTPGWYRVVRTTKKQKYVIGEFYIGND